MCDRAKKGLGAYGVMVMDFHRPRGHELLSDAEAGLDPDVVPVANSATAGLSDRSVAIFLLDIRSNKSPYIKKGFIDSDDDTGDFLGEEQWKWFQEAIKRSNASVNVIVNGLQTLADRIGPPFAVENWGKFPTSQRRLYQALLQENVRAPIIVSGDVHHAQILRKDCLFVDKEKRITKRARPLHEVTTSGMTHSWGGPE